MSISTRPAVLPTALLTALLLGGCSAGEPAGDAPVAAQSEEAEDPATEPAPDDDADAASEAASEHEPQQQNPATGEFVSVPADKEQYGPVQIDIQECSRPSGELSLDLYGFRSDGHWIKIEASGGAGTVTATQSGDGQVAEDESGPVQLSQVDDGSLLVTWGEYELAIENC